MFRKPVFWILFALAALGCAYFSYSFFPRAFPIVSIDISMDRSAALRSAADLAGRFAWKPGVYRQAATFTVDGRVQNFVELEAGGNEAFTRMIEEGDYAPYRWIVRHFSEGDPNETTIRFTPEGEPYGFFEKLSENEPGINISADSARARAVRMARDEWKVDFAAYTLIEESEEVQPGGRIDHTFVYELAERRIGEGKYRLRLRVSGDRLSELTRFVWIPEAFDRRYEEMRSANETIAYGALAAVGVLYMVGGCIIGLFILLRKRQIIWKPAVRWGLFIAFVLALTDLNQFPLLWMDYDTALSSQGFILRQIAIVMLSFLGFAALHGFTYIAAEGLTRNAFPEHIQLWKLWSRGAGASPSVFGRTAGGYLLVCVQLAFIIVFYLITSRLPGWWNPSDTLYSPDILATYFPWLNSIGISLHAGFWEECMFRAVPIAGAALIGNRFGHRKAWIAFAFILQALIFGAGHASYPTQPAYARMVELIIPSFIFGGVYVYFGLLPAIITHYTLDAAMIGVPVFIAESPGIWLDKVILGVLILVPLWVILARRWKAGAWREVPEEEYNRAWQPSSEVDTGIVPVEAPYGGLGRFRAQTIAVLGVAGFALWYIYANFGQDTPPIGIGRNVAETIAGEVLAGGGHSPGEEWRPVSIASAGAGITDRFVWQTGGKGAYDSLMGKNLDPPHWLVRYVRFEGPVEERAEEYRVQIAGDARVIRTGHRLPEGRPGDSLAADAARALADSVIGARFRLNAIDLKFISAEPFRLPTRKDWIFTYADTVTFPLPRGEDRMRVHISGSEISQTERSIHIPEEWQRDERNRENTMEIISIFSQVVLYAFIVAGAIYALIRWSRKRFSAGVFKIFFFTLGGVEIVAFVNRWPEIVARFSTSMPYSNQVVIAVTSGIISSLVFGAVMGLIAGLIQDQRRLESVNGLFRTASAGLGIAALLAGIVALVRSLLPQSEPVVASYAALSGLNPVPGIIASALADYASRTLWFLLLFLAIHRFSGGWRERRWLAGMALFFFGLCISGSIAPETLLQWGIGGIAAGLALFLFYVLAVRHDFSLLPFAAAGSGVLGLTRQAVIGAYPGASIGAVLAALVLLGAAVYWHSILRRENA